LDQSIDHLSEAIQLAPNRLEPYLELGLARKERREYQQALQIFEQATSIAPDDPRAPYQAGLALKESKDYKSSETMLRRAVNLAPHDLNIRRQLAAVVALNLVHNPRTGRN
jgi:tetratricopeptide (TPR) repeat protein